MMMNVLAKRIKDTEAMCGNRLRRMPCQNTRVHRDLVDRVQTILPSNEQLPCGVAAPAWPSFPAHFTEPGADLLTRGEMNCTLVRDRNMGTTSPGREPLPPGSPRL
jgi:hypothetical protein